MTRLVAEGIGVRMRQRPILQDVSLVLAPGELVALVGPNGAGKSTLMRCLAGIRQPSAGRVALDGQLLTDLSPARLARLRGYLPQSGSLAWPVTVRHLVGLGRLPFRAFWQPFGSADAAAVERALQATDAVYLADRLVTTLSGGERMRVLMARVLAAEPALMLADEPLAGLDPLHQLQAMQLLRRHCDAGGSALVALHDLNLACRFCDRLLLLNGGQCVIDDRPAAVMASGALEQVYRVRFAPVHSAGVTGLLPIDVLASPQ